MHSAPADGIYSCTRGGSALQMEIAQDTYMDGAAPETYSRSRAARLRICLRHILHVVLDWADSTRGK